MSIVSVFLDKDRSRNVENDYVFFHDYLYNKNAEINVFIDDLVK